METKPYLTQNKGVNTVTTYEVTIYDYTSGEKFGRRTVSIGARVVFENGKYNSHEYYSKYNRDEREPLSVTGRDRLVCDALIAKFVDEIENRPNDVQRIQPAPHTTDSGMAGGDPVAPLTAKLTDEPDFP